MWSGTHLNVLFNQASQKFIIDIHKTNKELELLTNGGPLKAKLKTTVPGFGLVWHDPNSIALSYYLANVLALIVRLLNKQVKFCKSFGKRYCYKPNYNTNGIPFLAMILQYTQYDTREWIPCLYVNVYHSILKCVFSIYQLID